MGGIALLFILILAAFFTWVIVTVASVLGFVLQPFIVFVVVVLLIVLISIT